MKLHRHAYARQWLLLCAVGWQQDRLLRKNWRISAYFPPR